MTKYAPITVYTYNRYDHFTKTIEALRNNYLAENSILYVVSDAAANEKDEILVKKIRDYSKKISGFKSVELIFRKENLGPLQSIYGAEREIIDSHGRIISMEDDNITSRNFLNFMNQGLERFEYEQSVYSICGYCPAVKRSTKELGDIWLYPWNISWGYATWKQKYDLLNPLINNYEQLKTEGILRRVNRMGGLYITDSLKRDYMKTAYFPDAILCCNMTKLDMVSVIPSISKVFNIGNDGSGNSKGANTNKYDVLLDEGAKTIFDFNITKQSLSAEMTKEVARFYNGRLVTRLARKIGIYDRLLSLKQNYG